MTISDRIRERRIELDLSQTDLAKKAGYTDRTTISKLEHNGNEITMKQVKRVAQALGVTSAYLMGWETKDDITGKALNMYEHYLKATPDIQSAVTTLLKL